MATGMQRLMEKHVGKKKITAQLNAILEQIDSEKAAKNDEVVAKNPPKKAKTIKFDNAPQLTPLEKKYFDQVWEKLEEMYDDAEPFKLAAINLAKTYALGKRLEERIEQDGGLILENAKGQVYAHPAVKLLQTTNSQILLHLKGLGMAIQGKPGKKKDEAHEFVSEFAQFQ